MGSILGRKLLKIIFGIYFLITLTLTVWQLVAEFSHEKDRVLGELRNFETTFATGISQALWEYNTDQLDSILQGMFSSNFLLGIKIEGTENEELAKIGKIPSESSNLEGMSEIAQDGLLEQILQYKFNVNYVDDSSSNPVGSVYIYSRGDAVFERVKYSFLLMLLNSVFKTAALWFIFLVAINKVVSKPLSKLSSKVNLIDVSSPKQGDLIVPEKKLDDELSQLSYKFAELVERLIENHNKIESFTRTLEDKVTERTRQLHEKSQAMQSMFNNIKQGICTVVKNSEGEIFLEPKYSNYLEIILGKKNLSEEKFESLFFDKSSLSQEEIDMNLSALISTLDSEEYYFDLNKHLLVTEYQLQLNSHKKYIELNWTPITNEDGIIDKILLVSKDITQERLLAQMQQQQKDEREMVTQVLSCGVETFRAFEKRGYDILNEVERLSAPVAANHDNKYYNVILILLHTLKGNARMYGLQNLSRIVHEAESSLEEQTSNDVWRSEEIAGHVKMIREVLEVYGNILKTKLSGLEQMSATEKRMLSFIEQVDGILKNESEGRLPKLEEALEVYQSQTLSELCSELGVGSHEIANAIGKLSPKLVIKSPSSLRISKAINQTLLDCLVHLIRNAIDHGIEEEAVRISKNKSPIGTITLELDAEKSQFIITDDGKGLNLAKLKEISPEIHDDEELANTIFKAGISTASKVSDISGRGLGMNAVLDFLSEKEIGIRIQLLDDNVGAPLRLFCFILDIPKKYLIKV